MKTIIFYVGVLPDERSSLINHLNGFNESQNKSVAKINGSFDDPGGYYEYVIEGTWDAYQSFMNLSFVKSLNHYEE